MSILALVAPGDVNLAWAETRHLAEWGLRRGDGSHDLASLAAGVRAGTYQLWVVIDENGPKAVLFTEIVQWPRKKVCIIQYAAGAGALDDLLLHVGKIEHWAVAQGCDGMMVPGRDGWEPKLAGQGYRKTSIILEKRLCLSDTRAAAVAAE